MTRKRFLIWSALLILGVPAVYGGLWLLLRLMTNGSCNEASGSLCIAFAFPLFVVAPFIAVIDAICLGIVVWRRTPVVRASRLWGIAAVLLLPEDLLRLLALVSSFRSIWRYVPFEGIALVALVAIFALLPGEAPRPRWERITWGIAGLATAGIVAVGEIPNVGILSAVALPMMRINAMLPWVGSVLLVVLLATLATIWTRRTRAASA